MLMIKRLLDDGILRYALNVVETHVHLKLSKKYVILAEHLLFTKTKQNKNVNWMRM